MSRASRPQRILSTLIITLVIGSLLFLGVAPMLVDDIMNPVDPTPLAPLEEDHKEFHRRLFIADLHADSLLWGRDLSRGYHRGQMDLPRLQAGNMALQAFSVVTQSPRGLNIHRNAGDSDTIFWLGLAQAWPPSALTHLTERALLQAERLQQLVDRSDGQVRLIRSQADLRELIEGRRNDPTLIGAWLTLEGAHALEGDLNNLDRLQRVGFRMLAPTHFFDNEFAGSAHGVEKGGLTPLGREWVRAMESRQLIIDLAHASERTIDDVLSLATRPVIVSHTGVRGTCDSPRNLSDQQIRRIAEQGGLIGVGFWPQAVCGNDVKAIVRALRHLTDLVGVSHVALGSDFDGAVQTPFDVSGLGNLTQALRQSGFTDDEVAGIMGGHARDFLLRFLPQG